MPQASSPRGPGPRSTPDAGRSGSPASGSFTTVELPSDFDPRELLTGPTADAVSAYYERPAEDVVLAGVGVAARIPVSAGRAPSSIREPALRLLREANAEADAALRPRLLGGFAFDRSESPGGRWRGFDCGWLVLPRVLFIREGERCGAVLAPGTERDELESVLAEHAEATLSDDVADEPGDIPLRVAWDLNRPALLAAVGSVAHEIRAGEYEKAVLAATREIEAPSAISAGHALARLREDYPHCHLFSYRDGDGIFLGASPERLVRLEGGRVSALGLAGSARRGATPEEDEAVGDALLRSAKDRIEHEIVVRAIREGLSTLTEDLHAPNQPGLLRLHNIQHLATEISARARAGIDILDLVDRLHPTPAVCGWPPEQARAVIARHERFDRGWYAGPVGWVDAAGQGEFAVALRSALVRGSRAWLFAGAGIMGDSDPSSELAEIELKFRPLTTALGGGPM